MFLAGLPDTLFLFLVCTAFSRYLAHRRCVQLLDVRIAHAVEVDALIGGELDEEFNRSLLLGLFTYLGCSKILS